LLPFNKLITPIIEEATTDMLKREAATVASKAAKQTPLIAKTAATVSKEQLEREADDFANEVLGVSSKPSAVEQTATALAKKPAVSVVPDIPLSSTKRPVFRPTSTSKVVKDEGPYLGDIEREGRFVDASEPILPKVEAPAVKLPEEEVPVWKQQYDLYKKYEAQGEDVGDFDPDTPFSWNNPEKAKPVVKQERETIPTLPESKVAQGDLDATSFARQGPSVRKQVLATIRQARTDSFDTLTNLPKVKELPDAEDVIAVVQGDFRIKEGREINPSKAEDISIVQDMATKAQKKLDALREEYKDTPPVKLYHGKDAYAAEPTTRYKTGFLDPQQITKYHSEMEVGGTSFTRDLNLNFESPVFGGTNPNKIVYTEMPYADYMFKRINMAPTAYDNKNLNIIAQSINGSDRVVRPVSLPRSSNFKETEDMITETDKLRPEGKGTGNQLEVRSAANDVTLAAANPERVSLIGKGGDKKGFINRVREETNIKDRIINLSSDLYTEKGGVAANKIYKEIRSLFNNYMEKADITSTKAGMGQRYHNELTNLNILKGTNDSILTDELLSTTSNILEKQGSKEKAMLLRSLGKELKVLGTSWASDAAGQVKNVNKIRELTQKLAKGGLVERR
jgi:hypothetical protein